MCNNVYMLQAALFTRDVEVGETAPTGEVDYDGYERVLFITDGSTNIEPIVFPPTLADYDTPVACIAALDTDEQVVGVLRITDDDIVNAGEHPTNHSR